MRSAAVWRLHDDVGAPEYRPPGDSAQLSQLFLDAKHAATQRHTKRFRRLHFDKLYVCMYVSGINDRTRELPLNELVLTVFNDMYIREIICMYIYLCVLEKSKKNLRIKS